MTPRCLSVSNGHMQCALGSPSESVALQTEHHPQTTLWLACQGPRLPLSVLRPGTGDGTGDGTWSFSQRPDLLLAPGGVGGLLDLLPHVSHDSWTPWLSGTSAVMAVGRLRAWTPAGAHFPRGVSGHPRLLRPLGQAVTRRGSCISYVCYLQAG